jgi:hypothetical protein
MRKWFLRELGFFVDVYFIPIIVCILLFGSPFVFVLRCYLGTKVENKELRKKIEILERKDNSQLK